MATEPSAELVQFQRFLNERIEAGVALTPEEALDLWRDENPVAEDFQESVAAIREALADMAAGDTGIPLEQFDAEFRRRHGLPMEP